jgi:hypothetical protein
MAGDLLLPSVLPHIFYINIRNELANRLAFIIGSAKDAVMIKIMLSYCAMKDSESLTQAHNF